MAPYFCEPAQKDLVSTKGLSGTLSGGDLMVSPKAVAICM